MKCLGLDMQMATAASSKHGRLIVESINYRCLTKKSSINHFFIQRLVLIQQGKGKYRNFLRLIKTLSFQFLTEQSLGTDESAANLLLNTLVKYSLMIILM